MINEPTIEQMNEAIAEFMGYSHGNRNREFNPDAVYKEEEFKYHSSWDWLMPVVEKIEDVQLDDKNNVVTRAAANVQIFYKACLIQYEPDEESGDTNDEVSIQTQGETKIEAVYKAVYQFIQWYNNQSTTTNGNKK
jgi:hypothetical protein